MKRILAPILLLTLLFPSLALGGEVTIPENSFSQGRELVLPVIGCLERQEVGLWTANAFPGVAYGRMHLLRADERAAARGARGADRVNGANAISSKAAIECIGAGRGPALSALLERRGGFARYG